MLVSGRRARHYGTHFAIYRNARAGGRARPLGDGRCVARADTATRRRRRRRRRVTAFYGRVIRSVTADRVIDVRPSVRQLPSLVAVLISIGRSRYLIIAERTCVCGRQSLSLSLSRYDNRNISARQPNARPALKPFWTLSDSVAERVIGKGEEKQIKE